MNQSIQDLLDEIDRLAAQNGIKGFSGGSGVSQSIPQDNLRIASEGYLFGKGLDWGGYSRDWGCDHQWVNVGFQHVKMACKHCDLDKPIEKLKTELRIGKKYYRSTDQKTVEITAETQNFSGTYIFLGSDGHSYNKDGSVERWPSNNSNQRIPNEWFLHEGDKT